ncbi:hypothetical protein Tco_0467679 [Tanacetum coccineum]
MAISIILVLSDSSEEGMGTPVGRIILFGTIPTTIPDTTPIVTPPTTHVDTTLIPFEIPTISPIISPSLNYTPALPDYSPASDIEYDPFEYPSSNRIPPLPATSPFLSSTNDSSDNDIPDTPPSPTHGTPFTEITLSTQRSPVASRALQRRVMILAPGHPIPHGRPYRYHPNGPVHMMTARKRVGPLPTHRLAVRNSVDYSSSDPFTSDDSSGTSSDSSLDDLSDSSSGHSSSDHSSLALPSGMRSSHQLCSLVLSIPHSSVAITERPSHSSFAGSYRKKSSSDSATDLEDYLDESSESFVPRETSLRDDIVVRGSDEPYSNPDIDLKIQAEINECIAYADALRVEGIYARVVVETVAREEAETSTRGLIEFTGQQSVILLERISELERDNTRLRGTLDVTSQRVTRLQRRELRVR